MTLGAEIGISNALIVERKRVVAHLRNLAKKAFELMNECEGGQPLSKILAAQSLAYFGAAEAIEKLEHLKKFKS